MSPNTSLAESASLAVKNVLVTTGADGRAISPEALKSAAEVFMRAVAAAVEAMAADCAAPPHICIGSPLPSDAQRDNAGRRFGAGAVPAHGGRPLAGETRTALSTEEAAYHLNRKPQTLRWWASSGRGDIRPTRVNGRLAWRTDDIRRLLGVGDQSAA